MYDAFVKYNDVKSSQESHSAHITSLHCTDMFFCFVVLFCFHDLTAGSTYISSHKSQAEKKLRHW